MNKIPEMKEMKDDPTTVMPNRNTDLVKPKDRDKIKFGE